METRDVGVGYKARRRRVRRMLDEVARTGRLVTLQSGVGLVDDPRRPFDEQPDLTQERWVEDR